MSTQVNAEFADKLLANIENKENREQLVKDNPALTSAVTYYVKEEKRLAADGNLGEMDQKALSSIAGIMAHNIKDKGPNHYVPDNIIRESLADTFTESIKPAVRNQAQPTEEETKAREQLVKNNPALAGAVKLYEKSEEAFSKDGNLGQGEVDVLKHMVQNMGRQIRTGDINVVVANLVNEQQEQYLAKTSNEKGLAV